MKRPVQAFEKQNEQSSLLIVAPGLILLNVDIVTCGKKEDIRLNLFKVFLIKGVILIIKMGAVIGQNM